MADVPHSPDLAMGRLGATERQTVSARQLQRYVPPVTVSVTANDIVRRFHDDPSLHCLAVVDDDNRLIGVLRSLEILRRGTETFFQELTGRRSCRVIMDPKPLVFDASDTLLTMSKAVARLDDLHLVDGFFVSEQGRYLGVGRMTDLLSAVAQQQVSLARYANPLTMLPGNVPIDQHIQTSLASDAAFVVIYFDLDNFKPYNDVYGYRAGDDIIALLARALATVFHSERDFLGHIGGDDFIVVSHSDDWEAQVQAALQQFDRAVVDTFVPDHVTAGGYMAQNRQGIDVFHRLVSLSAGIVRVVPGEFDASSAISSRLAEAKSLAKKTSGSSYFVDRRNFVK
jgi:GGDEF domain-containing protein